MTPTHEEHLNSIVQSFTEKAIAKYVAGQAEHGGHLSDMTVERLLNELENELIDAYTYLITIKQKLGKETFVLPPVVD